MKIDLLYGKKNLNITLPDKATTVIEADYVNKVPDECDAVLRSVRGPIDSPPLKQLASGRAKVGIIFCDITRATPNKKILPVLLSEIKDAGVARSDITLYNATGTHRLNTEEELIALIGEDIVKSYRIVQNNSENTASFSQVGTFNDGSPICLNSDLLKNDLIVLTGFIEPHFFAGFSGGPKAVMPGMASLETVMSNHRPEHINHKNARWGITKGNPVWDDILQAAGCANNLFLVNVALNRDKEIIKVFSGELVAAHTTGCDYIKDISMVRVDKRFDIVITSNSGYPLDLNLYQTVKGLSAALQVVKKKGSIIAASQCWDGIPDHGNYGNLLKYASGPEDLLNTIINSKHTAQDMWQAQIHAQVCSWADVWIYSDGLTKKQVEQSLCIYCENIEKTVDLLIQKYGAGTSICVLPEGPVTIPYL